MNEMKMLRLIVLVVFGATDNLLPSVWLLNTSSCSTFLHINLIALTVAIMMRLFFGLLHFVFVSNTLLLYLVCAFTT